MSKREQRLLKVLILLVLVIVLASGAKYYTSDMKDLQRLHDEKAIEASRFQQSKSLARVFSEDKAWLDEHEPDPIEYSSAMTQFQNFISETAHANGLNYSSSPIDRIQGGDGYYRQIQATVNNVKGTQKQMIHWLCELHRPTEYRAVTSLKIVPDEQDEKSVVFSLTANLFLVEQGIVSEVSEDE